MNKTLNQLRDEAYQNSVQHGFHDADKLFEQETNGFHALFAQRIALIHSELSEALESDRKDRSANIGAFDKSTQDFRDKFDSHIKDTVEDELSDAIIRILDLCGWLNIDIQRHVDLKMQYNAGREKMHGKKY